MLIRTAVTALLLAALGLAAGCDCFQDNCCYTPTTDPARVNITFRVPEATDDSEPDKLALNQEYTIAVCALNENDETLSIWNDFGDYSWQSTDEEVAKVDTTRKSITPTKAGTCIITATPKYHNTEGAVLITVGATSTSAASVTVALTSNANPGALLAGRCYGIEAKGLTLQQTAVSPALGFSDFLWEESKPSVAYVDEATQQVVAVAPGSSTITARLPNSQIIGALVVTVHE